MQETDNAVIQKDTDRSFEFDLFNITLKKLPPRNFQHSSIHAKKNLVNRFNSVSMVELTNPSKNPSKIHNRILNSQYTKSDARLIKDTENNKENINPNMVNLISSIYNTGSQINNKICSTISNREKSNHLFTNNMKHHFKTLDSMSSELNKVIDNNEDVIKKKDMKHHFNKRFSMNGSRRLDSRLNSINLVSLKNQFLPAKKRTSERSIYNSRNDYSMAHNESSIDSNLNVSRLKNNLDSIIEKNKEVMTNLSRMNATNVTAHDKSNISILNDNANLNQKDLAADAHNKNDSSLYINRNANNQNNAKDLSSQYCINKENSKSFSNFNLLKKYLKEYTYRNTSNNSRRGSYHIKRSIDKYGTVLPSTNVTNKNDNYGNIYMSNF